MELVELGKVFKIASGGTPNRKTNEYYKNGDIPWVKTGDLKPKYINNPIDYITKEGLDNSSAKLFPKETVLIAMYGATIGATSILGIEASTNQACAAFLPTEKCTPPYLYYFFKANQTEIIRMGVGGAQPNISAGLLKRVKIPLPPLPAQKHIASILDEADTLRQLDKQLIQKYDALAQSLFLEMFGDPVTNPKGWKIKDLGNLVENKDSKRVPVKSIDRDKMHGEYPYYGASGIIDYVDGFTHIGENLLIGEDGANLLARSTPVAYRADGKYWVNNHAHVLGYNGNALLIYIEYFINSIDLTTYISGSAQPKLNKKNMNQIKVSCPPLNLQNQFADRIQLIEQQKQQAQAALQKSEALFNSLLQKAFKGELV